VKETTISFTSYIGQSEDKVPYIWKKLKYVHELNWCLGCHSHGFYNPTQGEHMGSTLFILHTFGINEQMNFPLLKIMSYSQNNTLILCRYVTFQFHHATITFYSCFGAKIRRIPWTMYNTIHYLYMVCNSMPQYQ